MPLLFACNTVRFSCVEAKMYSKIGNVRISECTNEPAHMKQSENLTKMITIFFYMIFGPAHVNLVRIAYVQEPSYFNSLPPGKTFLLFCRLLVFFFKIKFFEKISQEYHQSIEQFGSRSGLTLRWGLICIQSVCKSYQQTTLGDKELNTRANLSSEARGIHFGLSLH